MKLTVHHPDSIRPARSDAGKTSHGCGQNHILQKHFFVLATQNPIEQEGTYPLPEAQLDRFMFIVRMDYPQREEEIMIARQTTMGGTAKLKKVINGSKLKQYQELVEKFQCPNMFSNWQSIWFGEPDQEPDAPKWLKQSVQWGRDPEPSNFIRGAKAHALIRETTSQPLKAFEAVAEPVLYHRIITNFHARSEGITSSEVINRLLEEARKEDR